MDKSGIALSVLSLSPPGPWIKDVETGQRSLTRSERVWGEDGQGIIQAASGLFAALALPDIEGSLHEIEYALDSAQGGRHRPDDQLWRPVVGRSQHSHPVFGEELNRRKAVVYTHPLTPACCGNLKDGIPPVSIEYTTDTTRTVASLLFSGTAARYPDIRWILSHGGGTMPFLLSRFQYEESTMKEKDKFLPKGLMYELKKFYYDTAQANHPGALAAVMKIVTPAQMLFGTDFPFRGGAEVIGGLTCAAVRGERPSGHRTRQRDPAIAEAQRLSACPHAYVLRFSPGTEPRRLRSGQTF